MENGCHDFLMVLAGGVIGLLSSLIIIGIQQWINHRGKTRIYFKITSITFLEKGQIGWGCKQEGNQLAFLVPMNIELCNTSNVTRVVRDLSVHLYLGTEYIEKMTQIEYVTGKDPEEYGTDNNAYSFALAPRSIHHHKCLFMYSIRTDQRKAIIFDTMKMRYYDEKDVLHEEMIDTGLANCWSTMLYEPDEDWRLLGERNKEK